MNDKCTIRTQDSLEHLQCKFGFQVKMFLFFATKTYFYKIPDSEYIMQNNFRYQVYVEAALISHQTVEVAENVGKLVETVNLS